MSNARVRTTLRLVFLNDNIPNKGCFHFAAAVQRKWPNNSCIDFYRRPPPALCKCCIGADASQRHVLCTHPLTQQVTSCKYSGWPNRESNSACQLQRWTHCSTSQWFWSKGSTKIEKLSHTEPLAVPPFCGAVHRLWRVVQQNTALHAATQTPRFIQLYFWRISHNRSWKTQKWKYKIWGASKITPERTFLILLQHYWQCQAQKEGNRLAWAWLKVTGNDDISRLTPDLVSHSVESVPGSNNSLRHLPTTLIGRECWTKSTSCFTLVQSDCPGCDVELDGTPASSLSVTK